MKINHHMSDDAILLNPSQALLLPNFVDDPKSQPDNYGEKLIKAGTPLTNEKVKTLNDSNATNVLIPADSLAEAQAILVHDVIITDEAVFKSVIKSGTINLRNVDKDIVDKYYSDDAIEKRSRDISSINIINRK